MTRSGSAASLKQPLWNLPSQGESFRGSTPDLSPLRRTLERTSSLSRTRPVSSYTAPPSPSQLTPPSYKSLSSPPTMAPPPPPLSLLYQEHASNKPSLLSTFPPPPPPPSFQITKPTWLPVQTHSIPMPTVPPPPPPPLAPPSSLSIRSPGFFYPLSPSPKPVDAKVGNIRDSPPPPPSPLFVALPPPPLPPPTKVPVVSPYRPAVPLLPPSYPCMAPSRKPPAIPASAGTNPLKER